MCAFKKINVLKEKKRAQNQYQFVSMVEEATPEEKAKNHVFIFIHVLLYLIVVIEHSQSCCTVLISIDAHHGFGGSSQWVFQVGPPGLIITAAEHLARSHFVWYHHHQPFTKKIKK